jgi:hypothetical protein
MVVLLFWQAFAGPQLLSLPIGSGSWCPARIRFTQHGKALE